MALFDIAQSLLNDKVYRHKAQLNRDIAKELNKLFPALKTPFKEGTIKSKLTNFKERWNCQAHMPAKRRKLTSCDNVRINGNDATFETLFTGESSNSGPLSLRESELGGNGPVNGGDPVSFSLTKMEAGKHPMTHSSAMKYLRANDIKGDSDEYAIANEVLKDQANLDAFSCLPDIRERRGFVRRTWNVKVHGSPNAGDMNS